MQLESPLPPSNPECDAPEDRPSTGETPGEATPRSDRDRRRRVLIDRRLQLRAGVLVTTTALVLVILLNLSLLSARTRTADTLLADSPELAEVLRSRNRIELGLMVFASAVLLATVFTITVLETHKTAGAAFNLNRQLARIGSGRFRARLTLRQDDNLREVEKSFNEMSRALLERASLEVEELEQAAELAGRVASPLDARELGDRLQSLARRKREQIS